MLKRFFARFLSFFKGIFGYGMRHKIQAGVLILAIVGLSYWGYTAYAKTVTTTQYVLASVRTAPIAETVTGSGQVASEHQLNLSPKASGTLTSVNVKSGDLVAAGQTIATIDSTTAQKTVRDASLSLESARISYLQSQTTNSNTVQKARDASFSTNATVYSDMGTVLNSINALMEGNEVSGSYAIKNVNAYSKLFNDNPNLVARRDRLVASYAAAVSAYKAATASYNALNRDADATTVAQFANTTYATTQAVAGAAKDLNDYLNDVNQRYATGDTTKPAILATHIASSLSYANMMNADVNSTLAVKNDLASALQSSGSGSATLSEESARINYQKAQSTYQDAQDALADYVVRAPFAGTIAQVSLKRYDTASAVTTVAVLVTKQQIATLSLNEVDAAKVKQGQKVELTFDALDGLAVTGSVAEVDTIGTVSQGVVSYTVKIGFDSNDPRILPGMTVNATIVTASKDSAIVVPSSAIKTQGAERYIEVATFTAGSPQGQGTASTSARFKNASSTGGFQRPSSAGGNAAGTPRTGASGPTVDASSVTIKRVIVTTGIASDTMTEVTSGLSPGEFVVSSSLNAAGKTTATGSKSVFSLFGGSTTRVPGATGGGGGARPAGGGSGAVRVGG